MKKVINWLKMQWAIFQYTDSVEATNGNSPQWKVDKKIKQIKAIDPNASIIWGSIERLEKQLEKLENAKD